MTFLIDITILTRNIMRYILRHHQIDIEEEVRFPAIHSFLDPSSSSLDLTQLSLTLIRLTHEFLLTTVDRIQANNECFYHGHHGAWVGIRCCGKSSLQLLGMVCKCRRDVDGVCGAELERQRLPRVVYAGAHLLGPLHDEGRHTPSQFR